MILTPEHRRLLQQILCEIQISDNIKPIRFYWYVETSIQHEMYPCTYIDHCYAKHGMFLDLNITVWSPSYVDVQIWHFDTSSVAHDNYTHGHAIYWLYVYISINPNDFDENYRYIYFFNPCFTTNFYKPETSPLLITMSSVSQCAAPWYHVMVPATTKQHVENEGYQFRTNSCVTWILFQIWFDCLILLIYNDLHY